MANVNASSFDIEPYPGWGMFANMMIISLLFIMLTIVLQLVDFKVKGRKKLRFMDFILFTSSLLFLGNNLCFMGWGFSGTFNRLDQVVGNNMSSATTTACIVQGTFQQFFAMGSYHIALIIFLNLYMGVVMELREDKKLFRLKVVLGILFVHDICSSLFTALGTNIRPRAAWCWIGCDEEGVEKKFTNHGRCWYRIVALYGWTLLDVFGMSIGLIFILRTLNAHQKTIVSTSKRRDPMIDKANFRTSYFLITYAVQGLLNTALNTLKSIRHDPSTEGKMGVVEYACSLLGPFWFFWAGNIKFWHYVVTPIQEAVCNQDEVDDKDSTKV